MAFTEFQQEILDYIKENPECKVEHIIKDTGIKNTTVRSALQLFEAKKEILVDRDRQPYTYSINIDSESVAWRNAVTEIQRQLLTGDTDHPVIKGLSKTKRSEWSNASKFYRKVAEALENLILEGYAIDTLEVPDNVTIHRAS